MGNHTCDGLEFNNYYIEKEGEKPFILYHLMKREEYIVQCILYCPFCGEKLGNA